MKLFADAATKTSNVAGIWLERVGTSATSSSKLNNNSTTSTAAKGDAIVLCFTVDADSGETPVSGAAYDGTFAPALMTTGSAPSALLGSSGGGCALGTSALVLAVLGLFIAKRRG
ncbi:MAG: hypothetical protein IJT20_07505 [Synergistaceae bacterium]|nr:hypothetical protein [Synergistaceae bacterium]